MCLCHWCFIKLGWSYDLYSAYCCIIFHGNGNGNVVEIIIHEHCASIVLLSLDLSLKISLEVNLV
jgi:hypothetical protein